MTVFSNSMLMRVSSGPEFVGAVAMQSATGAGLSYVVDAIPGVQAGDLILCFMCNSIEGGRSVASRPSGWSNLLSRSSADGGNAILDIKTATGSEPANYTWTWQAAVLSTAHAIMVAYRNVSAVNDIPGAFSVGSSATQTLSSITPTLPGVLIGFFSNRNTSSTMVTPPAGMDFRTTTQGLSSTIPLAAYDLIPSPAGSTGTKSAVWSNSAGILGTLLQLE